MSISDDHTTAGIINVHGYVHSILRYTHIHCSQKPEGQPIKRYESVRKIVSPSVSKRDIFLSKEKKSFKF